MRRREVPPAEEVAPGVIAVALAMEHRPMVYSFAYLVDAADGGLCLIDTGMDSDRNWDALQSAISAMGRRVSDLAAVIVSHLHHDHAGMAARVRAASGARVAMHEADARAMASGATFLEEGALEDALDDWAAPSERRAELRRAALRSVTMGAAVEVDEAVRDGDVIRVGSRALHVLHTPGHTRGHIVVAEESSRLLFTGDHLLPMMNTGVGLGGTTRDDDPVADYLRSLDLISSFDDHLAFPGHGYRFEGVAQRCAHGRGHLIRRRSEVDAILADAPGLPVWGVAERVRWTVGWENLAGAQLFSALRQTSFHVRGVRAAGEGPEDRVRPG